MKQETDIVNQTTEQLAVKTETAKQWHLLHSYRSNTNGKTFFLTYCGFQFDPPWVEVKKHTVVDVPYRFEEPDKPWSRQKYIPAVTHQEDYDYQHKLMLTRDIKKVSCGYCSGVVAGLRGTMDITGDIDPSVIK